MFWRPILINCFRIIYLGCATHSQWSRFKIHFDLRISNQYSHPGTSFGKGQIDWLLCDFLFVLSIIKNICSKSSLLPIFDGLVAFLPLVDAISLKLNDIGLAVDGCGVVVVVDVVVVVVVVVVDLFLAGSVEVFVAGVVVGDAVVVVDRGTPGFLVVVVGTAGTIRFLAASSSD